MSIVKVRNIFLIGPMGAGKSTIGRALAKELKLEFYDSDEVIEERAGADISWIFDIEGEEGFRRREQKVIDELTQKTNIVLATGGGVVITPENRNALAGRGTVIYLKTSFNSNLNELNVIPNVLYYKQKISKGDWNHLEMNVSRFMMNSRM